MTFVGIFLILVGWIMAIGLGVLREKDDHSSFRCVFVMMVSLCLIASGVYILC